MLSLHIRYYDGQKWGESWDSSSLPMGRQLPVAVAIQIQMAAPGGRVMDFASQVHRADGDTAMVAQLRKKERGVALLAVLLGIALMTLVVMDFAMTSGLGFVSAANQANEMRAGYLARSGINVGLGLLAADARTKAQSQAQTPVEALTDAWATPFPPIPLEGGKVTLSIVDEARKININSMVQNNVPQPLAIQRVQRLFTVLDVNVQLVQGIVDWITPNNGAGPGGTGDFYMGLKPPYQPRYSAMPTIADLQMVEGFNEAIFNRVSPFLTVMPEPGVNANTASPQVLAALEPQLMEDEKLVQETGRGPHDSAVHQYHRHHEPARPRRDSRTGPCEGRGRAQHVLYDHRHRNFRGRPQNYHRNLPSRGQRHRHDGGVA